MINILLFLISLQGANGWAKAKTYTPVYTVRKFPLMIGKSASLNKYGLFEYHAFTAFPGTVFRLLKKFRYGKVSVYRVSTDEYPCRLSCYVDSRFLTFFTHKPPKRVVILPSRKEIIARLLSFWRNNVKYCWGCNYSKGIDFYSKKYGFSEIWSFKGVDCSGILYEATGGYTPRDTSSLFRYGVPVNIRNKTAGEIFLKLKPLDLILWKHHMVIVMPGGYALEAINKYHGRIVQKVIRTNLMQRLIYIRKRRSPANAMKNGPKKIFIVRRWFGNV